MSTSRAYRTLDLRLDPAGFATLVLDRPERFNALSSELRGEMADAIARLEADPAVRVLILTGAGRAFTVGMDLDEWRQSDRLAAGAYEQDPVQAILSFTGPVIGAINGLAVTGGLEIALACDLLLASTEARFADTHAQVGLLPGWGGSVRLVRRIGLARAKELALSGRFMDAHEARDWGLVNHVVAPDELLPRAERLARDMLAAHPDTLRAYKRLLDQESAMGFEQALAHERHTSIANNSAVRSEDIDARVAAMVQRRKSP